MVEERGCDNDPININYAWKKSIIRDGYWLKEAEKKMEDMNKLWRNFLW